MPFTVFIISIHEHYSLKHKNKNRSLKKKSNKYCVIQASDVNSRQSRIVFLGLNFANYTFFFQKEIKLLLVT